LRHERRQEVFDVYLLVAAAHRPVLGVVQSFLAFLGETVEVHAASLLAALFRGRQIERDRTAGSSARCTKKPK
jgi:hypothetical protein